MSMRIRLTYAKAASLRFTGNLDMQRLWERTLRRAHLSASYTQGFHPQPRINQAGALPLGISSRMEIVDIWLENDFSQESIWQSLNSSRHPGIELLQIVEVPEKAASIQNITAASEYTFSFLEPQQPEELRRKTEELIFAEVLPRTRKDKNYNLRPLIETLEVVDSDAPAYPQLRMRLSSRPGATGRPDEVLDALGIPLAFARIERTRMILEDNQPG